MPAPLGYSDYPGLDPEAVGLAPNAGYGALQGVPCPCVDSGAAAALASALDSDTTSIEVVDASRLPQPPFVVQAQGEQMQVTAIAGSTLTAVRGYGGTMPVVHPAGAMLYEVLDGYVYLVADHPVKSIGAVYVDGVRILEGYTLYTGQSGDELAGFQGRAVVLMGASSYVGRQYNLPEADALRRTQGQSIDDPPVAWSHSELVDGAAATYATIGGESGLPTAWAAFAQAYGTVLGHLYVAEVQNPSAGEVRLRLSVRSAGLMLSSREFTVPPLSTVLLSLWRGQTQEAGELVATAIDGPLRIQSMARTLFVDDTLENMPVSRREVIPSASTLRPGGILSVLGRSIMRADYPVYSWGQVKAGTHLLEVTESTGAADARVRLTAQGQGYAEVVIKAGATETLTLVCQGGEWSTPTLVSVLCGSIRLDSISKSVEYYPSSSGPARQQAALCSARVVVGASVAVDVEMAVDTVGDYGGVGTLIERPDYVMKHYLLNYMGFEAADIDDSAFESAGVLYAAQISGGYRFAFNLAAQSEALPSEVLRRMARESRSTIAYSLGKWVLNFLPATAPEALKTISSSDLAGHAATFVFSRPPLRKLGNSLVARYGADYGANYSSSATLPRQWAGVVTAADSASIAKYGTYARELEFRVIRHEPTAQSVLDHILTQRSEPLMTVRFTVFYEHFDLAVGDTIAIDNDLYDGMKFYIESISRIDQFRAELRAIQWGA